MNKPREKTFPYLFGIATVARRPAYALAAAGLISSLLLPGVSLGAAKTERYEYQGKLRAFQSADVRINDKKLSPGKGQVGAVIHNQRTLVPLSSIAQELGAKTSWNPKTQTATVEFKGKKIDLTIGQSKARVNGKSVSLPDQVAPMILSSRTMVPFKFLTDQMGLAAQYDAKTAIIRLTTPSYGKGKGTPGTSKPPLEADLINQMVDLPPSAEAINQGVIQVETPTVIASGKDKEKPAPADSSGIGQDGQPALPAQSNGELSTLPKPGSDSKDPVSAQVPQQPFVGYEYTRKGSSETFYLNNLEGVRYEYFYLSSPSRLVIDIYKARLSEQAQKDATYPDSAFLASLQSGFDTKSQRLRLTLRLQENVSTREIKIEKGSKEFKATYTAPSLEPSARYTYTPDRDAAEFSIKLGKAGLSPTLSPISSSRLQLRFPKDLCALPAIKNTFSDRLLSAIEVRQEASETVVDFAIKERVSAKTQVSGNTLKVIFSKAHRPTPLIVLDAGHGAHDSGALGADRSVKEKDLNLTLTQKLAERIRQEGYELILARDSDIFLPLAKRAALANQADADVFISIHHNNMDKNSVAKGIETLFYPTESNRKFAKIMQSHLIKATGATDRGIVSRKELAVLNGTKVPAVLLEMGFMSNWGELEKLQEETYQNTLVEAVIQGLAEYFQR